MYDLRRGRPDDLSFVYRLERLYIETIENDCLALWQDNIGRHLDQWVAALPRMTVAEAHNHRLGYVFWEDTAARAVLASVNVDPSFRRKGVASVLMRSFEDEARLAGFSVAELGVMNANPARYLYETLGYRSTEMAGRYSTMIKAL